MATENKSSMSGRARVLVIDDDTSFNDSISRLLQDFGGSVESVFSLREANRLLNDKKYDLVICDMYFDDSRVSGDQFLVDNKELLRGGKTLVVTGRGLRQIRNRQELEEMGVTFLEKGDSEFPRILEETILGINQRQSVPDQAKRDGASQQELIALAMFDNTVKLVSMTPEGEYRFLDQQQNLHNILYLFSSETLALGAAIDELESLINGSNAKEQDFQDFFERNPDFILNDDYKRAYPQIVLTKDDGETLVPDFVLEPLDQGALSDLLELKLPAAQVFVLKKSRMRFSAAVMEACAQLREYSLFFDEERNRTAVKSKYGLLAYKPKMFLIIGRRGTLSPISIRQIESDTPNLYLRTYDDIANRMKARVDAMKKGKFRR